MRRCLSNASHVLVHRKGFQNISSFLKTWQTETCPRPPESSSSASPVRCSLEGRDHRPGTGARPEEPPPLDATPPAGHEETGPVKGDAVSGSWKQREGWRRQRGAVDSRRRGPGEDVQARGHSSCVLDGRANEPEQLWPREDYTGLGTEHCGHRHVRYVGGRGNVFEPQLPISKTVMRYALWDRETAVNIREPVCKEDQGRDTQ